MGGSAGSLKNLAANGAVRKQAAVTQKLIARVSQYMLLSRSSSDCFCRMMAAEAPMSRNNPAKPVTTCAIAARPYSRGLTYCARTIRLIAENTCRPTRDNAVQLAPATTAAPVPPEGDSGIRRVHCRGMQGGAAPRGRCSSLSGGGGVGWGARVGGAGLEVGGER